MCVESRIGKTILTSILSRITAYLRLVILADGFQQATKKGLGRDSDILTLAIDAARTVIDIVINKLFPTGHLRYAMDANFLYVSFASAFLLNVRECLHGLASY